MKKLLAVLVCMAMALALVPGVVLAATTSDGRRDFYLDCSIYDDHVVINGCTSNSSTIDIPSEIGGGESR